MVPFPKLSIGQRLEIEVVRRHTPVFPSHLVLLQLGISQRRLSVGVRSGGQPLRWTMREDDRFEVAEEADGLLVEASELPRRVVPRFSGAARSAAPTLRIAWDAEPSWESVGRWYTSLTAEVERGHPTVSDLARQVAGGLGDPMARLEALSAWVKRNIRYEAVEVGIGGWVPTPAHQVLARGWGDCKDMSELLAESRLARRSLRLDCTAGESPPED